jgi:hypothetical protein
MKSLLLFLALTNCQVFLYTSLSAQPKSEQVRQHLGPQYETSAPTGTVKFRFAKMELRRDGDGRKTYADLLRNVTGYSDADNLGKLQSIQVEYVKDGRVRVAEVPRVEMAPVYVESSTGDPVRPRISAVALDSTHGEAWSLPDSAAIADNVEVVKRKIGFYSSQVWSVTRPVWGVIMYFFWSIFSVLIAFGVIAWYWAKLSANEEMPDIHRTSSRSLLILVGSTFTVFLLNCIMTLVYWEVSPLTLLICMVICAWVGFRISAWIVPNFRAKMGGRIQSMQAESGNPRLDYSNRR